MKKNFSERIGIAEASQLLQTDSMNDALRNSIWNLCYSVYQGHYDYWGTLQDGQLIIFGKFLWIKFLTMSMVVTHGSKHIFSNFLGTGHTNSLNSWLPIMIGCLTTQARIERDLKKCLISYSSEKCLAFGLWRASLHQYRIQKKHKKSRAPSN